MVCPFVFRPSLVVKNNYKYGIKYFGTSTGTKNKKQRQKKSCGISVIVLCA